MHLPTLTLAVATCLGLTLCACTSDDDAGPDPARTHATKAYAGRLPNMCDELISPVTVAKLLDEADPGQRTYTYSAPGAKPGLLRGMTCRQGVSAAGTALTVSALEFATRAAARKQYAGSRSTGARAITVSRRPAALSLSTSSSDVVILDGAVTVEVGLGRPASQGQPPPELLACARAVIAGLDGAQ
ncbi:MAG: hypothetical protein QOK30_3468 [Nocardioidaceae bacterium]|nr:hypothetical protein [Nocardioidaceae bacterium]